MAAEAGWYLYAFLSHGVLPRLPGIDGRSPLSLIVENGMAALASRVSLAEFGEEPFRRNLEDLRWLEEKARRHESIVEAALVGGPVLPMKFGTIFLDTQTIRGLMRRNVRRLMETLEFLRNKEEWGVKGFASREALRASILQRDPELLALSREARAKPPGQAFFIKRKIEEGASAKSLEREDMLTREFLERIQKIVEDLAAHPPLLPEAPRGEAIVLNVACLVRREGMEPFLAEVERWNQRHANEGFKLVASGPWPPYHFVPQLDDDR